MARTHAVCFDLDDTLWDVEFAVANAEKGVAQWVRERVGEGAAAWFTEGEKYDKIKKEVYTQESELLKECRFAEVRWKLIRKGIVESGYGDDDLEEICDEATAHYLKLRSTLDLFPSCLDALEELSGRYTLSAVTNGNACLRTAGIDRFFSHHVAACHPGMRPKPHPRMFEHASAILNVPNHRIVMVGDSLANDIQPALDLGMKAVLVDVKGAGTVPPEGVPKVSHLRELPSIIHSLLE